MGKKVNSKKLTPLTHLGYQAKQVLAVLSKHQKISINAIQIPSEIPPSMEIFNIPNLSVTIPTKFSSDKSEKNYIIDIQQDVATNTMMIFTDVSAQGSPGPTGSGVVITSLVEHIKLIYCPAHKGIKENEIADNLAKIVSKKASHLPPRADISLSKVKEINRHMTLDKWGRRNFHK